MAAIDEPPPVISQSLPNFKAYLSLLLPAVVAAEADDLERTLFATEAFDEGAKRFLQDASVGVIYVEQVREEGDG